MKRRGKISFWVAVFISAAFLAFGSIKSLSDGISGWNGVVLGAGVLLLVLAYFLTGAVSSPRGGAGGLASSLGENSNAEGGAGGKGVGGLGGVGGDAVAEGKGSTAKGGRGGDA